MKNRVQSFLLSEKFLYYLAYFLIMVLIIYTACLICLLLGEFLNMDTELWIALISSVGAAVSMIAASIYQIVRTVKDGKNIETINKKSDTINTAISDTGTKIYSDTQNIRESTKNLNIIESHIKETKDTVLPAALQIGEMKDNIKALAEDLATRKKLNEYVSQGLNPEDTINRVSAVFEKNAKLSRALEAEQQNYQLLNLEYQKVIEERDELKYELEHLKAELKYNRTQKHNIDYQR